jgi:predicted GNAT family acetyltransferase
MELMPQVMKAEAEHQDLLHQSKNTVPDAPFKKSWHEMALKKMIHHAAANGYDSIAITPGAEQADRYGLAKHLGEVQYNHEFKRLAGFDKSGTPVIYHADVEPEQLPNYIGKEVATKLLAQPKNNEEHSLKGVDLQVGGEGMKGFYDKIVPNFLNQFGKKYGAKVSTKQLPIEGGIEPGWVTKPAAPREVPVHHFPITPEMREDVTKNGVPLYAKGGEVEVKPTNYDPNLQRKHPELEAAIRGIAAGTTTHKQLDKLIAKHKPIKPYEFVPQPATDEDAERALKPAQKPKWRGHEQWPAGRKVGLRLDIPAYETHGVWVNSVHDEEGKGEDNLKVAYGPVSSVKNAVFDPTPHKAEEVGTGEKGKSSFARIKGDLHHMSEDEAVEHMKTYLNHPDYAQVGFDPRRHGHFYDRKTMKPVTHSAHVVQIGPLVLAHKPTYGKRENYATGGPVPPLRPLNPQLAAMREQLAQQAALHKAYDEAMKNVYTNQMPTFAQWVKSQGKAAGGSILPEEPSTAPESDLLSHPNKSYSVGAERLLHDTPDLKIAQAKYSPTKAKSYRYLSYQNNEPVGVLQFMTDAKNPKSAVIQNAYVKQAFQKQGIGSALLARARQDFDLRHSDELSEAGKAFAAKTKAKGGSIKPVGYTKEQVTVSPNLDAMRYELMSVKQYTKKVK